MDNFWSVIWVVIWSFVFVAYLFVLFYILTDLFRDRELSGWWKALWIIFLIFAPYLTALVYIIARGRGMSERQVAAAREARSETDAYIKHVAATGGGRRFPGPAHRRREGPVGQRHHQSGRVRQAEAEGARLSYLLAAAKGPATGEPGRRAFCSRARRAGGSAALAELHPGEQVTGLLGGPGLTQHVVPAGDHLRGRGEVASALRHRVPEVTHDGAKGGADRDRPPASAAERRPGPARRRTATDRRTGRSRLLMRHLRRPVCRPSADR